MGTCAPATGKTVPDFVFPMSPPVVPPLASCTLCVTAVLPPAPPPVVLVDGVDMPFLQRLLMFVLRRGFQRPFFGVRTVIQRPFFSVVLW